MGDRKRPSIKRGGMVEGEDSVFNSEEAPLAQSTRSPFFSARNAAAASALLLGSAAASYLFHKALAARRDKMIGGSENFILNMKAVSDDAIEVFPVKIAKDQEAQPPLLQSYRSTNFVAVFAKKRRISSCCYPWAYQPPDDQLADENFPAATNLCVSKIKDLLEDSAEKTLEQTVGGIVSQLGYMKTLSTFFAVVFPYLDRNVERIYFITSGFQIYTSKGISLNFAASQGSFESTTCCTSGAEGSEVEVGTRSPKKTRAGNYLIFSTFKPHHNDLIEMGENLSLEEAAMACLRFEIAHNASMDDITFSIQRLGGIAAIKPIPGADPKEDDVNLDDDLYS